MADCLHSRQVYFARIMVILWSYHAAQHSHNLRSHTQYHNQIIHNLISTYICSKHAQSTDCTNWNNIYNPFIDTH